MPINLRYGQQAVARGFINKARLDQCLAKQKQLEAQGKKVSLRMILEKAKLLSPDQLSMIDRDLNIKVVKKQTGQIQKPGGKLPSRKTGPTGAQDFAGGAVPKFSGMSGADPDATVFSPPPADMQAKIKAERDRAKGEAKRKQEQEASAFFGDDNASPFGGDPFGGGGGDMASQPFGNDMAPEPFGNEMQPEPFGGEMQPEPFGGGQYGEMQPEPFGGGDLAPEPMGFGDDNAAPFDDSGEPQELSRMDSSPKISSLSAEYDNFASPDEEALPTVGAFDESPAPARGGRAGPPRQDFGEAALAPAGDDFESFGNDFRSPEEMEMSAPPKTPAGGIDATMFSPPPPDFPRPGGKRRAPWTAPYSARAHRNSAARNLWKPSPQPMTGVKSRHPLSTKNRWPSPPRHLKKNPSGAAWTPRFSALHRQPCPRRAIPGARTQAAKSRCASPQSATPASPKGRQGADDFADIELPKGRVIDDVPTSPASMDDDVHPLRRGVGTSSAPIKRTTGKPQTFDEPVADELPSDSPMVDVPDETGQLADEPPLEAAKGGKGKLPGKAAKEAKAAKAAKDRPELPQKEVPVAGADKGKKGTKRVVLAFAMLLMIVIAVLTLPIALYDQVPQVKFLRDDPRAKPVYDYIDYEIFNRFREWAKLPVKETPRKVVTIPAGTNAPTDPPTADGANTEPANGTDG